MNKFLTKSMVLLLALLLCLGVIGCHPTTQNGEDTTEGTTEALVEREPIVLDYEGDLTPGGTPEIRAEYGDSVYVGKAVPAFYYTEEQAIALLEQIEELYDLFENGTPESFVNGMNCRRGYCSPTSSMISVIFLPSSTVSAEGL